MAFSTVSLELKGENMLTDEQNELYNSFYELPTLHKILFIKSKGSRH